MRRVSHTLRKNKRCSFPRRIVFVDVETEEKEIEPGKKQHILKLGWACLWEPPLNGRKEKIEWFFFTKVGEFWDWLCSKVYSKTRLVVIAHHASYDLLALNFASELTKRGFEISSFYEKFQALILSFKNHNKKILFLDNQNFFRGKLADWGKVVGREKKEIDFKGASFEELKDYCHRDVEILLALWRWWHRFLKENDLGDWRPTVAGQAFNAFRHRFMEHDIFILADDEVSKIEREAYRGGRVSCFFVGERRGENFYQLDVNGMYAHVMRENEFPAGLISRSGRMRLCTLKRKLRDYCVIARVKINVTEPVFPVKKDNRIIYPLGEFTTVLTTPELKYALKRGWIVEVQEVLCYRKRRLFKNYVEFFQGIKQKANKEGNKLLRDLAKLFLNSLYGKFGQFSNELEEIGTCSEELFEIAEWADAESGERGRIYKIAGKVFLRTKREEGYNAFPAIAAHVTAYARMYLWELIKKAGERNCYYCDTDSLIVNECGYENLSSLIDQDSLGKLKLEMKSDLLKINAPKDYVLGEKVRRKGIKSSAERIDENTYIQEKFPSLKGAMLRFRKDVLIVEREIKELKREIYWGIVADDGWVRPLILSPSSPRSPP